MSDKTRSVLLVIGAALFVVTACGTASSPASTPTPAAVPSQSSPATGASTAYPSVEPTETGRFVGLVLGSGGYPGYSVKVPGGWSTTGDGHFVVKNAAAVTGLSVWDVDRVPMDPCHWQGRLYDPGQTVDDLVRALAVQPMRQASKPIDVILAGYPGQYLEWSVPGDMVVTGDADFEGCDVEPSNGHRDFISWLSTGGGSRFQQVAGQIDRLWVLDVAGQRLVVDATYSSDTTQAERDELGRMVESLLFVAP